MDQLRAAAGGQHARSSEQRPTLTGTYGLVALIVLGGAAAGVAAAMAARRVQG